MSNPLCESETYCVPEVMYSKRQQGNPEQKYAKDMPEVCIKTGTSMDVPGMFRLYSVYVPCESIMWE